MAYTDIDKPSDYFRIKLYAGNAAANRAITWDETDTNMQPDMLWFKSRTDTQSHCLFDSVRGAVLRLIPNSDDAEGTENTNLDSFDTNGFQVDAEAIVNGSSRNYVTWGWKAGTSFTNDASSTGIGSIDSSGSVNTDAGFSITKFTADGNNLTAAHGLGVAPKMIITKNRSISKQWSVYHSSLGANKSINLNTTAAADTDNSYWNNTAPTSTTLSYGTWSGNNNGNEIIAYCFAEKQGYSKFGSYTGNGNADGTFVYTGFKPRWIMIKGTNIARNWGINDTKRSPINQTQDSLYANVADAETGSGNYIDFLSNGFKLRDSALTMNGAYNYIYMAFAENPFVTSSGVPATAR